MRRKHTTRETTGARRGRRPDTFQPRRFDEEPADFQTVTPALHEDEELPEMVHSETESPHSEDQPGGGDKALGLYLSQMGSIPLLNRQEELDLAQRLDATGRRYRHAAMWNWDVLALLLETFETIRAGKSPLERNIDVVPSLGLTTDRIRARLGRQLGRLRKLLDVRGDVVDLLRGGAASGLEPQNGQVGVPLLDCTDQSRRIGSDALAIDHDEREATEASHEAGDGV